MLLTKIFLLLKNTLIGFYNTGVDKEKDESKQKYIIFTNIVSLLTCAVIFFSGILFFVFTKDNLAALANIIVSFLFLLPFYLNKKGYPLIAKISMPLVGSNSVLASCCIFSHNANLENYFFDVMATCAFLFTSEERKWRNAILVLVLIYYIIESTSLHYYLPAFNLSKDTEKTKLILFASYIMVTFSDVVAFIYIIWLREKQLIEKEKALQKTQYKLQVQNEDLQTFSIAASHSLQTPIHVSKFLLNKVKNNYESPNQNSTKKSMDIIEDSLNQMDQLVNGLFSYARIIKIEESYELCDVINELAMIKKRVEEKFTNGTIIVPNKPFYITTNKLLFSIIIQNVIDNGLKYNKSENPIVQLQIEKNERIVSFFITDNGIGIEKKFFNKIFEPFKRVNPGNNFAGNGLGLSGAKRAAERIGGKLFCKHSSDKGSTFQLDILLDNYNKS